MRDAIPVLCAVVAFDFIVISYGCVSVGLITTGLVFTVFAIFQKDSQIGKVWLAGPTTMVVGLVLFGKVIIDWGPAMLHGREGTIDSLDQLMLSNPLPTSSLYQSNLHSNTTPPSHRTSRPYNQLFSGTPPPITRINLYESLSSTNAHNSLGVNGSLNAPLNQQNVSPIINNSCSSASMGNHLHHPHSHWQGASRSEVQPSESMFGVADDESGAIDRIIYSARALQHSKQIGHMYCSEQSLQPTRSMQDVFFPETLHSAYPVNTSTRCDCVEKMSQVCTLQPQFYNYHHSHSNRPESEQVYTTVSTNYGSIETRLGSSASTAPQRTKSSVCYQGETFVLNERNFFI